MDVAERMGLYLSRLNPRTVGHLSEGPKIRARLVPGERQRHDGRADGADRRRTVRPVSHAPVATWSKALMCRWICWRVVAEEHLALHLPPENCCDMTGAIRVARAMMPNVRLIDSYMGSDLDTSYVLTKHDGGLKWRAITHRPRV